MPIASIATQIAMLTALNNYYRLALSQGRRMTNRPSIMFDRIFTQSLLSQYICDVIEAWSKHIGQPLHTLYRLAMSITQVLNPVRQIVFSLNCLYSFMHCPLLGVLQKSRIVIGTMLHRLHKLHGLHI